MCTLQSRFLLAFQWLHVNMHFSIFYSTMLFHECYYSVRHVSFKKMLSPGVSGSMCGQPIYLLRVVLTVIDFFSLFAIQLTEALVPL